jgi:oxalate decarboxylase
MSGLNRREVLGAFAGATGGSFLAARGALADEHKKIEELPTFRYALEQQKGRIAEGGSAKEATVKQLPISTGIAGVSMRLKPGGLRELHWHANAAEWAFVVKGRVRTTVLGPDSTTETNDFEPGDVWYFPRGHGHALACLGPEESHFILVFDNGSFSEYGTFGSTDWLGHTTPEVLAKSLGMSSSTLSRLPKEELYIVQGRVPPERPEPDRGKELRPAPLTHRFPLLSQRPQARYAGGVEWRVTVKEFPISTTISAALMELKPGALREPHWHPHANEWFYLLSGRVRVGIFGSAGRARVEEFSPGDVGYVPQGFAHYIENGSEEMSRILVAFDKGEYQEISLSTWLAANPGSLVADNFKLSDAEVANLPKHRVFIAGGGQRGE